MKKIIILIAVYLQLITLTAQNEIVKIDFENHSIQNLSKLPFGEPFILEGKIEQDIVLVEIQVKYENAKKPLATYIWDRSSFNTGQNFELVISQPLYADTKYDFTVNTFTRVSLSEKKELAKELQKRVYFYLRNHVEINGNNVTIENPKKTLKGLNTLAYEALYYFRSRNGVRFDGFSDVVLNEFKKIGNLKFRKFFKKKSSLEKNELMNKMLNDKILYLTEIVLSELEPFLSSEIVKQKKSFVIHGVETKHDPFTLPVNAGLSVWSINADVNNVSGTSTSITPSFGVTFPFSRKLNLNNSTISSFGLSLGVLSENITKPDGSSLTTPSIGLPVYTALGVKLFNVIRVSSGALIVSNANNNNFNKLEFYPTFNVALELNLWIGIKK
jgi:hypothetical protein